MTDQSLSVVSALISGSEPSRNQQNLACGFALFHIDLGLGGFGQRISVLGAEFELAFGGPAKHFACTPLGPQRR